MKIRTFAAAAAIAAFALTATGCSGSTNSSSTDAGGKTLTYWASN